MQDIVISVLKKPRVPGSVYETLLPICINNEAILTFACKEGHFYITKLILDKSHDVNIQSALISACSNKLNYIWNGQGKEVEKLKIVKYILGKYENYPFDLKVVCQRAFRSRKYNIIEWFVLNIDISRLDVQCIMKTALLREKFEILENITTEILSLDKNEALKSLTQYYNVKCSAKILKIVSIIFNSTEDEEEISVVEIVNTAYERKCFEVLMWIHEKFISHMYIDAKKILMLACKNDRIDVAEWILHSFEHASLDIDAGELFMLACEEGPSHAFEQALLGIPEEDELLLASDKVSHVEYLSRKIGIVKWVFETFDVKSLNMKLGVLKLISLFKYNHWDIGDFLKLCVSILKKCFSILSSEDKEDIMNKCLKQKYYDVVNWILENVNFYSFDKQNILNKACANAQIETVKMLHEYFYSLDMNEAIMYACTGSNSCQSTVCEYLLSEIDKHSIDMSKIVSTICKEIVCDNILAWILFTCPGDQDVINNVLISCCQQGQFNLLK